MAICPECMEEITMTPSERDLIEDTVTLFLILLIVCVGVGVLVSVYVL